MPLMRATQEFLERRVYFSLFCADKYDASCAICGKTDAAIAETASWFWSLQHSATDAQVRLVIENHSSNERYKFDFAALQPEHLAQILDSNPTRNLSIQAGTWSPEQSVILASRPYALNLTLYNDSRDPGYFRFKDEGTAFVDALQSRQSSFGVIDMIGKVLSTANMQRLINLDVFEKIGCCCALDEGNELLPLYAKAEALSCVLHAARIRPEDFDSVGIFAKDLAVTIYLDHADDWVELLVSFTNRLAKLGHLEKLVLEAYWTDRLDDELSLNDTARVGDAMVHAINSNPKLTYLDLSGVQCLMECAPPLENIFIAAEGHAGLRILVVKVYFDEDDSVEFDYSWLERLLSRNRNITVLDESRERISNGPSIDNLYALNRFYNGSAALVKEQSAFLRPLLVTTALGESAAGSLQYTALLLSDHTDTLCELIRDLPEDAEMPVSDTSGSSETNNLKRKARFHASRAAKKAASREG